MERPYLRPVYDEPEFIVRTVWRLYGGWWDGNPATLKPAPERSLALELAELAGGAGVLADRALALLAAPDGDAAEADPVARGHALRLAGHLAELAWLAAPDDPGVQEVRRTVFTRRADAASSTMAHGRVLVGGPGVRGRAAGSSVRDRPRRPAVATPVNREFAGAEKKCRAQLLTLAPVPTSVIAVNAFTTGSRRPSRSATSPAVRAPDGAPASSPAPRRHWGRWAVGLAVAAPLVLGGCNFYPSYGASRGATSQGQDTFKLYSGMMTTGIIVGGLVFLLILWTMLRYRRRSDECPGSSTRTCRSRSSTR